MSIEKLSDGSLDSNPSTTSSKNEQVERREIREEEKALLDYFADNFPQEDYIIIKVRPAFVDQAREGNENNLKNDIFAFHNVNSLEILNLMFQALNTKIVSAILNDFKQRLPEEFEKFQKAVAEQQPPQHL